MRTSCPVAEVVHPRGTMSSIVPRSYPNVQYGVATCSHLGVSPTWGWGAAEYKYLRRYEVYSVERQGLQSPAGWRAGGGPPSKSSGLPQTYNTRDST